MSPDGGSVLLLYRDKRPDDLHFGKYLGLGGRLEPAEDVATGAIREIREESGLIPKQLALRGTLFWPGFGHQGEDWFGFVFRVDTFSGEPHLGNHEGTLEWVALADLSAVPMWEGDRRWLPMVFDDDPRQFHGVMPYRAGAMLDWHYQRI